MDRNRINRIHGVCMFVLGILMILAGVFSDRIPHELRMVISIGQIVFGCIVITTSILKLKGKF